MHEVDRGSDGHGSRQVGRPLAAKFAKQLEDQIGAHGKADQKDGGIRAC
jgi:hypothetical protein